MKDKKLAAIFVCVGIAIGLPSSGRAELSADRKAELERKKEEAKKKAEERKKAAAEKAAAEKAAAEKAAAGKAGATGAGGSSSTTTTGAGGTKATTTSTGGTSSGGASNAVGGGASKGGAGGAGGAGTKAGSGGAGGAGGTATKSEEKDAPLPTADITSLRKDRPERRKATVERLRRRWGSLLANDKGAAELKSHARRVAFLQRVRAVADTKKDAKTVEAVDVLLTQEDQRHGSAMNALREGALPTGAKP